MSTKSKKFTAGIGLALLLLLVFLIGRWTVGSSAHEHSVAEATETTAPAAAAETIWTCSMHPQVRQPNPGQCPICGMDLIPLTSDDDSADDSELPRLRVSERSAALMNIQTWPVERRVVEREVRLLGRVNYDETRQRTITAWFPGRLDRLFVNVEGARIQQGDPVAEIYSPALISAQEELIQALRTSRARGGDESAMVDASRERLRLLGLDTDQIREIEERGSVQDSIVIYSPLDGVITERIAVEGTFVQAGDRIAALAALDRVYVDLEAYERDLPWLAQGQTVRFSVEGLGGETLEGHIAQINPFVDRGRRTAQVRVLVDNSDGMLKPGMFARGTVAAQLGGPDGLPKWREELPLLVSATAALITGRRAVVYVKIPDTDRPTFELRQVTLGPRAGDMFIVHDGVHEGELVVTQGNFKIDSELQLRGRPSMMAPEGGAAPDHDHGAMDLRAAPARSPFADEVDSGFTNEIAPVVTAYLEATVALADDDAGAAASHLDILRERLLKVGRDRLSGEAALSWEKRYGSLETILERMGDEPDITGLRNHFQELSHEIEAIYVDFGRGKLPAAYRIYCSMAREDRGGTWLQREKGINNPYFGAMMLRCGEVLGELALEKAEEE